jgi:hypothetical protein
LLDPKTKKFTMIDSCFAADHNMFDEHDNLVFGQDDAVGWLDTVAFDKTHDAGASQGWCPGVVDTNGDGKISTAGPSRISRSIRKKDHRIEFGCYAIGISPTDGSIWCSGIGHDDQTLVRLERGANPPMSCKAEVYIPATVESLVEVFGRRRHRQQRRCLPELARVSRDPQLRPPQVQGAQWSDGDRTAVPRGWSVYTKPGPSFKGAPPSRETSTDMLYLTNIDHHDALGLGKDVLLGGDVNADSFFVLRPQNGQMQALTLRVPYPLGIPCASHRRTHRRSQTPDGRVRGMWTSYSMYTPWHQEGGKGSAAEGRQAPNAAESAGEITFRERGLASRVSAAACPFWFWQVAPRARPRCPRSPRPVRQR